MKLKWRNYAIDYRLIEFKKEKKKTKMKERKKSIYNLIYWLLEYQQDNVNVKWYWNKKKNIDYWLNIEIKMKKIMLLIIDY